MSQNYSVITFWIGLGLGALLAWAVAESMKGQRDFWKQQYCFASEHQHEFCEDN